MRLRYYAWGFWRSVFWRPVFLGSFVSLNSIWIGGSYVVAMPDRDLPPPPQPLPNERPVKLLDPPIRLAPPIPELTPNQPAILIRQIEVVGNRILQEEIRKITQSQANRSLTVQQLSAIADEITQLYLDQGYLTSRAILEPQTIQSGNVRIRVIEGQLEKINVEGTQRLNSAYIRDRVAQGAGVPLNARKLEDQLRLLLANPLLTNVVPTLQASSKEGSSVLTVRVKEAPAWSGGVSFDNFSPPSVGSERASVNLRYRNLTGNGDELAGSYARSLTGGSSIASFSYRLPLNSQDGSLEFQADINRNRVTQSPFDQLNIKGASERYELTYRQPLWRSSLTEFALSFGFAFQDGQTFIFNNLPSPLATIGPDQDGVSRTSVLKFGQDYLSRDQQGAWLLRSQLSLGTGLFQATKNPDAIPDGQFVSWLGQIQRVQRLSDRQLLIAQLEMQLTPDGLLPEQQFVIGGGQSVRGYRQNARTADNGIRFSLENRIALSLAKNGTPILQMTPFIDLGGVWNVGNNPNLLPRQTFLLGAGVGLLWQPSPKFNLRLDYGLPIVNLNDRGNNIQDDGVHFSINYQF